MKQREFYLDRIRVILTALVILHHTAITYGASGGWYYVELPQNNIPATIFTGLNQSYFMGFFFLLAGYFTPDSLRRKGPAKFLLDRLVRLGVPLLVFAFLLGPLAISLAYDDISFLDLLRKHRFSPGPLWFAEALLLFSLIYVVWRKLVREPAGEAKPPSHRNWLIAALGTGTGALLLRQVSPLGKDLLGMQIGYFASYILLFAVGCVASRNNSLQQLQASFTRRWTIIAWCAAPTLWIAVLAAQMSGTKLSQINVNTGFSFHAILYAFWEPFVAWGIMAAYIVNFRDRWNQPSKLWESLGAAAYGAYIVHTPVLVGISRALAGWHGPAFIKMAIVGTAACVGSTLLALAIRSIPGVKRVL